MTEKTSATVAVTETVTVIGASPGFTTRTWILEVWPGPIWVGSGGTETAMEWALVETGRADEDAARAAGAVARTTALAVTAASTSDLDTLPPVSFGTSGVVRSRRVGDGAVQRHVHRVVPPRGGFKGEDCECGRSCAGALKVDWSGSR